MEVKVVVVKMRVKISGEKECHRRDNGACVGGRGRRGRGEARIRACVDRGSCHDFVKMGQL